MNDNVIHVDFDEQEKITFCERDPYSPIVCVQKNCDGEHHYWVSVYDPIPWALP